MLQVSAGRYLRLIGDAAEADGQNGFYLEWSSVSKSRPKKFRLKTENYNFCLYGYMNKEAVFAYLDRLKAFGVTNMFGRDACVEYLFDCSTSVAHQLILEWMKEK